jgi:hypothetical protein
MSQALQFFILTMAGWLNRQQEDAVDYLREEIGNLPPYLPSQRRPQGRHPKSKFLGASHNPEEPDASIALVRIWGGVVRPAGRAALSQKQPSSRERPGKDIVETGLRATVS